MKLKYSSIFLFIATSLFGSSALAAGSTNKITFTGRIVEASCDLTFTNTQNNKLDLGTHPTSNFIKVGDKSAPVAFDIQVSKDCQGKIGGTEYKAAYIGFSAKVDPLNKDLIAINTGTNQAKGVGIGITQAGNPDAYVDMYGSEGANNELKIIDSINQIKLQAFYEKSPKSVVKAGNATATAIVTVHMN